MEDKTFKTLWVIVQVTLFFAPFFVAIIMTPYQIEKDKMYIEIVEPRVLDGGSGDFNIEGAVEDKMDAEGKFIDKQFKQQNKELYYLENLGMALVAGLMFQIFNMLWVLVYQMKHMYN